MAAIQCAFRITSQNRCRLHITKHVSIQCLNRYMAHFAQRGRARTPSKKSRARARPAVRSTSSSSPTNRPPLPPSQSPPFPPPARQNEGTYNIYSWGNGLHGRLGHGYAGLRCAGGLDGPLEQSSLRRSLSSSPRVAPTRKGTKGIRNMSRRYVSWTPAEAHSDPT